MDVASVEDLFRPFAKVTVKKLFGGLGVYHEGVIIACVLRGETLLRTDAESEPVFAAAGSRKWNYEHKASKAKVSMPYWSMPEAAFDDEGELLRFCRLAFDAARRAAAGKANKAVNKAKPTAVKPAKSTPAVNARKTAATPAHTAKASAGRR